MGKGVVRGRGLSFGDVDTNKDGFINVEEFDRLLEAVAAIPRRYGLAPLSTGDAMLRMARHKVMQCKETAGSPW